MTHPLDSVNLTELIELCREAGLGNFGRNTSRAQLYEALEDLELPEPCLLEDRRKTMETHVQKNYARLRTQLPGCNGKCVNYGCPDIIVQSCWDRMKDDML